MALGGTRRLYIPPPVPEPVEAQLVGELRRVHGVREVLLVGEHQEHGVLELVLLEHVLELLVRLGDPLLVVGVDDEDEALGVLEVVSPEGADLVLAADVPHGEADVLVLDRFHVEADRGDRRDDFAQLELVEDGGFAGGVEAHHQDPHLFLAEKAGEDARNR